MASEQDSRLLTPPVTGAGPRPRNARRARSTMRAILARVARVVPAAREGGRAGVRTLADLRPGERAIVARCHGLEQPLGQRLLQLGLLRGKEVELLRRAVGGDPIEVKVLGSALSLRLSEARLVELEP